MNQAERDLIANLFQRIRGVESAPRDSEAEAYISEQVSHQPHAPYAMAQTVVVQDKALEAATARIEALERELSDLRETAGRFDQRPAGSPWGPRAQDAMGREPDGGGYPRRDDYGRQDDGYSPPFGAPQSTPGARPTYGGSGLAYGAPQPSAPQASEPSRGGGFLSGALQTAAGVAAGAMLFQGVRSLFGGEEERGHAGAGEAARFAGGEEAAGAGGSTMDSISDQFAGWFGGGREGENRPHDPEPQDAADDFDPADGDDDRWI